MKISLVYQPNRLKNDIFNVSNLIVTLDLISSNLNPNVYYN